MTTKKPSETSPKKVAEANAAKRQKINQVKAELAREKPPVTLSSNESGVAHKPAEKPEQKSLGQSIEDILIAKSKASVPLKVTEKDGHAIVTVGLPARSVETSIAYSSIDGCAIATVEAWEKVRNVKGGDAAFADCLPAFRQDLIYSAENIYRGGQPSEGETTMAKFEREVGVIRGKQETAKAKAAKAAA